MEHGSEIIGQKFISDHLQNKNQLIDLSDPEGPFRRQSATLVAYLVEHNEVRELEINDLERLDLAEW